MPERGADIVVPEAGEDNRWVSPEDAPDESRLLLDYLALFLRRRRFIFVCTALFSVLGIVLGLFLPPSYTAKAYFMPKGALGEEDSLSELGGLKGKTWNQSRGDSDMVQYYSVLLKTAPLLTKLLETEFQAGKQQKPLAEILFPEGAKGAGPETGLVSRIENLRGQIQIGAGGGKVLTLSFTSMDPQLSADVVNVLLRAFIETPATAERAQRDVEFLEARIKEVREALAEKESSIAEAKGRTLDADQPDAQLRISAMQRDAQLDETLFGTLTAEYGRAQIRLMQSENDKLEEIEVIESAMPPIRKSGTSKRRLVMLMFVLGLSLSGAISFVLEKSRQMALSLPDHPVWSCLSEAKRDLLVMGLLSFAVLLAAGAYLFLRG